MTLIVTLHSSALLLLIATFQQVYLVPLFLCCWTSLLFLMLLLGLLKRSSATSWSAFLLQARASNDLSSQILPGRLSACLHSIHLGRMQVTKTTCQQYLSAVHVFA
ncbi:hypothetical protein WJX77_004156 [Trebouxia sp. C0004]